MLLLFSCCLCGCFMVLQVCVCVSYFKMNICAYIMTVCVCMLWCGDHMCCLEKTIVFIKYHYFIKSIPFLLLDFFWLFFLFVCYCI